MAACAWLHLLVEVRPEAVPPGQARQRVLPQGHRAVSGSLCCQQECLPCRYMHAAGLDKACNIERAKTVKDLALSGRGGSVSTGDDFLLSPQAAVALQGTQEATQGTQKPRRHLARQPRLQEERIAAQEAKHADDRLPRTRHAPQALCNRVMGSMQGATGLAEGRRSTGRTQRLRCRRIIASGARTWPALAALCRAAGLAHKCGRPSWPLAVSRQHRASSSAGALSKCERALPAGLLACGAASAGPLWPGTLLCALTANRAEAKAQLLALGTPHASKNIYRRLLVCLTWLLVGFPLPFAAGQ